MAENTEPSLTGIATAAIHGDLTLDHGALAAPRSFPGRTPTDPIHA
jgi:hypothetical protein